MPAPCIALIIEDEPAVRSLLMMMLSELNCAVLASESGAGLGARLKDIDPDIVFLDIGLRGGDVSEVLTMLAGCGYAGPVQIVSGQPRDVMTRVKAIGDGLGLRMAEPIAKPFGLEKLEQVLPREQRAKVPAGELVLEQRVWLRPLAGDPGLIDLRLFPGEAAAKQLEWWLVHGPRYSSSLLALPATCSFAVRATLADLPDLIAAMAEYPPAAFLTRPTIVLDEDDVFGTLETARSTLQAARRAGLVIRLADCGTRFFSAAGHRPLPIDQAEIGRFLERGDPSSRIERFPRLADVAHRAGSVLLADDVPSVPEGLGKGGLDLWRSAEMPWAPVEIRFPLPPPPSAEGHWRPVTVKDALALRKARFPDVARGSIS